MFKNVKPAELWRQEDESDMNWELFQCVVYTVRKKKNK